jgi:hypothetical protein
MTDQQQEICQRQPRIAAPAQSTSLSFQHENLTDQHSALFDPFGCPRHRT